MVHSTRPRAASVRPRSFSVRRAAAVAALVGGIASFPSTPILAQEIACARGAGADSSTLLGGSGQAMLLLGVATDLEFEMPAQFVERADGTATLTGRLASLSKPALRFILEVDFGGRIDSGDAANPPPGSPKKELVPSSYADQGGPIDPAAWAYYLTTNGTMTGLGEAAGAVIQLGRMGPAFQVGFGASGRNLRYGGSGWVTGVVLHQPNQGVSYPQEVGGDMNFDLDEDCSDCADPAELDGSGAGSGGHAIWLPGIGTDFVFDASGSFIERVDGTAHLSGVISRKSDDDDCFLVDVEMSSRKSPGDAGYAPAGSPKTELGAAAYLENGGTVDTGTWHYYEVVNGTLTGCKDYAGAKLDVTRAGPAFQVGFGANGKNVRYGGSGWLNVTTVSSPKQGPTFPQTLQGDINVDLGGDCERCVEEAIPSSASKYSGGHAITLEGIASDLVATLPGAFIEYPDGTARYLGVVARQSSPSNGFLVDIEFTGRLLPGEAGSPPSGSPKLELKDWAYADQGGPIDPSAWRYYTTTDGHLCGFGSFAGVVLHVWRMGPAFQVGFGASGKNMAFGASGWLHGEVTQQQNGGSLPSTFTGDINVDVPDDCIPDQAVTTFGHGCPGSAGRVPELSLFGVPAAHETIVLSIQGVLGSAPVWLALSGSRGDATLGTGCSLLVGLPFQLVGPVLATSGGPGDGMLMVKSKLPALLPPGARIVLQALVLDPGAAGGVAGSAGLDLLTQ